jgi:uncharacterized protein
LHNRITKKIHLRPFTLKETKLLLASKSIALDNTTIVQLYMALGGIPHYYNKIEYGNSAQEIIQQVCFSSSGNMFAEFDALYKALFANANNHIEIVKILFKKWRGLTRQEIVEAYEQKDGGSVTNILKELVQCDFVVQQNSFFGKKNKITFRLIDEYSIFYLSFMEGHKNIANDYWMQKAQTNVYKIWSGYAFENVCFRHLSQIKNKMHLSAISTSFSSFSIKGNSEIPGTQIDLVLDRADQVINLFEIKYNSEPIIITKEMAKGFKTKMAIFRAATNTKKQLFTSLIAANGIVPNANSTGLLANNFSADDLFD